MLKQSPKYKKIANCRIGGGDELINILNLGDFAQSGYFPASKNELEMRMPLDLVWSPQSKLVQLAHSYEPEEMFGDNYGYRSGLNQSMIEHLGDKIDFLEQSLELSKGDIVLDIGSNDATLLKSYKNAELIKIGIDPTGLKFKDYYPDDYILVPEFFSSKAYKNVAGVKKAKIITSISMFYDLENPVYFAKQIAEILDCNGIWHLEQSYLPSMIHSNSYDTICHEHLEYYTLTTINSILNEANLKIYDVSFNDINGGSFAITCGHQNLKYKNNNDKLVKNILSYEDKKGFNTIYPYIDFTKKVYEHKSDLIDLIAALKNSGKKIYGYGASTKGNTLIQFCKLDQSSIDAVVEVNPYKFGRFTPGSHIPIISDEESKDLQIDYFLVFPWHFRNGILKRESTFRKRGGKFIFPLPQIQII